VTAGTLSLKHVGRVELNDLIGMCSGDGDGVPYPFWRTNREPYWGEVEQTLLPFADRFDGELSPLREWAETYRHADIWIECRVAAFTPEISNIRLLAHRAGAAGFIAAQRPGVDVVDVYGLSPLDLGAAVAGLAELSQPGTHPAIRVPGFLDNFIGTAQESRLVTEFDEDDDGFSVHTKAELRTGAAFLDYDDVTLLGTVQSRCQPSAVHAVDWARGVVAWLRVRQDGDYVYTPDFSQAVPVTAQTLRMRIDELIAADVALLRQRRGLS
jgi:hypothetical protein